METLWKRGRRKPTGVSKRLRSNGGSWFLKGAASFRAVEWSKAEPILSRTYTLMEDSGRTTGQAVIDDLGLDEVDFPRFKPLEDELDELFKPYLSQRE